MKARRGSVSLGCVVSFFVYLLVCGCCGEGWIEGIIVAIIVGAIVDAIANK